jgi:uncharacterized RDD family membrane protein YckC
MTPELQPAFCSECGRPATPDEMVRFGDRLICPNCKNAYAQKLREGVATAGFVRYGGFWLRFVAVMIDGIIMAVPIGILQAVLFGGMGMSFARNAPGPNASPDEVLRFMGPMFATIGISVFVAMILACVYETFFLVQFAATPGKMAVGVKVLRPDGSKLSVGRAIGRHFAKLLSGMILYIGYIMAGFDAQKRALHDMICDTRVIKSRA